MQSRALTHTTGGIGNGCEEASDEGIRIDAGIEDGIEEGIPCWHLRWSAS